MPSMSEALNSVPALANATPAQRAETLDRVYEVFKRTNMLNSEQRRNFRDSQLSTFLEDDAKSSPDTVPIQPNEAYYEALGAGIERTTVNDEDTYLRLKRRNTLETLQDVGRIASDPKQYAAAVAKTASDLAGLGFAAAKAVNPMRLLEEGETPGFLDNLKQYEEFEPVKKLNSWYNKVVKDDPELSRRYHFVTTDMVMGTFLGAARVAKVGKALAEAGQVFDPLSKTRTFFAPVVSTVLGGQAVYEGVEGIDKVLEDSKLSPEVKTGVLIGSTLALGLASAMGPERVIESVLRGEPSAVKAAGELGNLARRAEESGMSFRDALAANPELSPEARKLLGLDELEAQQLATAPEAALTDGKILNQGIDNVTEAVTKAGLGEELTHEDANITSALQKKTLPPSQGSGVTSTSHINERYPLMAQLLSKTLPDMAETGSYTPDAILAEVMGLVDRSGLGMDARGWELQRETIKQGFDLWDEARMQLPKGENNLKTFLDEAFPEMAQGERSRVESTILKAFPELDSSFKTGVLPEGASAMADSLAKLITVGLDQVGLKELAHEIGHLNFWHGLDSGERMAWMDLMRTKALEEASWASSFPEYTERMKAIQNLDEVGRANAGFWLLNPSEMYAQQFSAYIMNAVLPNTETLNSFQKAWNSLKSVFSGMHNSWDTLPQDTKEFMARVLASPEPTEARAVSKTLIDQGIETNPLYKSAGEAQERVDFLGYSLRELYPIAESLPVAERVAAYQLGHLTDVAQLHALRLMHDLPGGDVEELRLVARRFLAETSDGNRPVLYEQYMQLAEGLIGKQLPRYGAGVLDDATRNAVLLDSSRKAKREMVQRLDEAEAKLRAKGEPYTREMVESEAGVPKEVSPDSLSEDALAWVQGRLAKLDAESDMVADITRRVLASKGLTEAIDPSFANRLSRAEQFAKFASGKTKWDFPEVMWKSGVQTAYVALTGLEPDPDGVYIPMLGNVSWSPETFLKTAPYGVFLLPGGWKAAKFAGGKAKDAIMPQVDKAISKLPFSTRLKMQQLHTALKSAFTSTAGYAQPLRQILNKGKVYGMRGRNDFYVFAETMHRHFSPEQRADIARIYEQAPGYKEVLAKYANNPEVMLSVEMARKLYGSIPERFAEIGLTSERFEDLGDHYLNRLYDNVKDKPIRGVFLDYNISPVRGNFLKKRGLVTSIKDGNEPSSNIVENALTSLRQNAEAEGLTLEEGLKINAYVDPNGTRHYAITNTKADEALKAQGFDPLFIWDDNGRTGYFIERVGKNKLQVRRDYTVKERKAIGEVVDVAIRGAAMGEQLERDLRQGRIFYDLANSSYAKRAENAKEARALRDQGWVLLKEQENKQTGLLKYGALSGMYVHPDAVAAVKSLEPGLLRRFINAAAHQYESVDTLLSLHKSLLNTWKVSKTVLSPRTHMNNFVSNMFMGYMLGHNPVSDLRVGLQVSRLRNLEIQAKELVKDRKFQEASDLFTKLQSDPLYVYYKEMKDAGITDSTLWARELSSRSLLEELKRAESSGDLKGVIGNLSAGYNAAKNSFKKGVRKAGEWYEKGDLLYKMGAFVNARKQGKLADEAVRYAYEAYFDYGNLSPVARTLKDTGLVPFVSYIYNAIPAIAKSLTEHPERVAMLGLVLEGMHMASVASIYGDEDVMETKKALEAARPEYMQNRAIGGILRTNLLNPLASDANLSTPRGEVARNNYLDISRMLPLAGTADVNPTNPASLDIGTPGELLFTFINQNPIFSTATTIATGKNPELKYSILEGGNINTEATKERRISAIARNIYNTIFPNIPALPGTPSFDQIGEALAGAGIISSYKGRSGLDNMGMPKSLGQAVSASFGIVTRDVYPEMSLTGQMQREGNELSKEKTRLKRFLKNPRFTEEAGEEEVEKFVQSSEEVQKRQEKRATMLQRLQDARQRVSGGSALPR